MPYGALRKRELELGWVPWNLVHSQLGRVTRQYRPLSLGTESFFSAWTCQLSFDIWVASRAPRNKQ